MGNIIRDYCIQRTIRKGKEEKVYRMICAARDLADKAISQEEVDKATRLLRMANRITETYHIYSKRICLKYSSVLEAFART